MVMVKNKLYPQKQHIRGLKVHVLSIKSKTYLTRTNFHFSAVSSVFSNYIIYVMLTCLATEFNNIKVIFYTMTILIIQKSEGTRQVLLFTSTNKSPLS